MAPIRILYDFALGLFDFYRRAIKVGFGDDRD